MAEEKKKKKYTKIGAVLQGKYGPFLVTGNTKSTKPEYNYDVLVRVQESVMVDGKPVVKTQVKNAILTLQDPRNRKDADLNKIPDTLLYDVSIVEDAD